MSEHTQGYRSLPSEEIQLFLHQIWWLFEFSLLATASRPEKYKLLLVNITEFLHGPDC